MILHIDMDAFFASIEQAINPRLKGKPLVVGARPNKIHTVVCAASYEAKALGIGSGMSVKDALDLCPHVEFVTPEQEKYIWTSEEIRKILEGYGFLVEYPSIDEFRLDVPDDHDHKELAEDIRRQIYANFNITASVGIAKNCLLAKLASKLNKPNGVACLNDQNLQQVLAKTPVEKLCGIGPKTAPVLQELGIKDCWQLYEKSAQNLEQLFGKNGLSLYFGLHSRESLEETPAEEIPKSIGHSYTFPMASKNPGFIKAWIRILSEMVSRRMRQQGLASQTVHLWLASPDKGDFGAQRTFQQAINDGFEIYRRALKIGARSGLNHHKIRAIGVSCAKLQKSSYSHPLFREEQRREGLIQAVDKINSRFGEDSIYPAVTTLARKMLQ
jgi:DNA polymerase-4